MKQLDGDGSQAVIPTFLFGTVNGVIGVVAQLPRELFLLLEKLQVNLTKVIRGIGGLSHSDWRSFTNERKTVASHSFLDGDLIEQFLDLRRDKMDECVAGLGVTVEDMCKKVEDLTRLH
jgi:DNA damage-binding protein 1